MKKILLSAALMLALTFGATGFAATTNDIAVTAEQEKEYKKIETTQVPAEVLAGVNTRYSGYSVSEAYVSDDGQYKLVLSKDGKTVKAIYKANGEFVKEKEADKDKKTKM